MENTLVLPRNRLDILILDNFSARGITTCACSFAFQLDLPIPYSCGKCKRYRCGGAGEDPNLL